MGKVMVSGCFDMLHSGHVAFLKTASEYGELYVCAGSDETVYTLKGRYPVVAENERIYLLNAVRWVKEARISGEAACWIFYLNSMRFNRIFL